MFRENIKMKSNLTEKMLTLLRTHFGLYCNILSTVYSIKLYSSVKKEFDVLQK